MEKLKESPRQLSLPRALSIKLSVRRCKAVVSVLFKTASLIDDFDNPDSQIKSFPQKFQKYSLKIKMKTGKKTEKK